MTGINKEVVAIFLLVVLAVWVIYPALFMRTSYRSSPEGFDATGTIALQPLGTQAYGLRGEPLRTSDIRKIYIRADPNVMLNRGGGEMWISNNTPEIEGIKNCQRVKCPTYGYDNLDQCWQCPQPQKKFDMPPLNLH